MVITGKDWSGRVRNDQDLSGIIRTGQESYGNFNIFLIFSKLAQEILTFYNLTHLCTNVVLVNEKSGFFSKIRANLPKKVLIRNKVRKSGSKWRHWVRGWWCLNHILMFRLKLSQSEQCQYVQIKHKIFHLFLMPFP